MDEYRQTFIAYLMDNQPSFGDAIFIKVHWDIWDVSTHWNVVYLLTEQLKDC